MQNTVKLLKKKMKHSLCSVTTQTKGEKNENHLQGFSTTRVCQSILGTFENNDIG